MESTKPWVPIVVALIGVVGSVWVANITAGRKFDDEFNKVKQKTTQLEASSRELTSDFSQIESRGRDAEKPSDKIVQSIEQQPGKDSANRQPATIGVERFGLDSR